MGTWVPGGTGWGAGTGTHVLENFELQGRGVQVVQFPCSDEGGSERRLIDSPKGAPPAGPAHRPPFHLPPGSPNPGSAPPLEPVPSRLDPARPRGPRPGRVLTAQLQDLPVLVGVRDAALLVSRRLRRGVLDGFGGRVGLALLQGLHSSQGHQGLGQAERSASHSPQLYRARRLGTFAFARTIPSSCGAPPPTRSQRIQPLALHPSVGSYGPRSVLQSSNN